jgi:hypothetical protein
MMEGAGKDSKPRPYNPAKFSGNHEKINWEKKAVKEITEQQAIEVCAKVMGWHQLTFDDGTHQAWIHDDTTDFSYWNPLKNDSQAFKVLEAWLAADPLNRDYETTGVGDEGHMCTLQVLLDNMQDELWEAIEKERRVAEVTAVCSAELGEQVTTKEGE